jgi:internalin A
MNACQPKYSCAAACKAICALLAVVLFAASIGPSYAKPRKESQPPDWLGKAAGATAIEPITADAPLVGMDVRPEPNGLIAAVAPIFGGPNERKGGPFGSSGDQPVRIMARPGYAVAGVVGRAKQRVLGFRLIFMRLRDGAFDPRDRYESRWIGSRGDKEDDIHIRGDGKPLVAFVCRYENLLNGFTLSQDLAALAPAPKEIVQGLPPDRLAEEAQRVGGRAVRDPNDPKHPVIELDFTDCQLTDADLAMLAGQTSLKRLDLKDGFNRFGPRSLAALETLQNLEYLNLEHNFGDSGNVPLHLSGLPHLHTLGLDHSNSGRSSDALAIGNMKSLEELTLSGDTCTDASMEQLAKLVNLRLLYIHDTAITDIGARQLSNFHKLRSLTVFSSIINDDGYTSIEGLHDLELLRLGAQELTPAVLDHVKAPNLKSLYLGGAGLDDGIVPYLLAMPKLESLHLGGTRLTDQGLAQLGGLKNLVSLNLQQGVVTGDGLLKLTNLKNLKVLKLSQNPIGPAALAAIKNFPALEVLDLSQSQVTAESLANLRGAIGLRELDLSGAQLNDDALANLEPLVNLEKLGLGSTHIHGNGLTHLRHLKKLKQLELEGNPLTDDNVAPLGEMISLQSINLTRTRIGDSTLSTLAKLPNLEVLGVSQTKITDQGIKSLSTAAKLRELSLSSPRITDASIAPLLKLRELQVLGLTYSLVSNKGADKLRQLPNLRTLYLLAAHVDRRTVQRILKKAPKLKIFYDNASFPNSR